MGGKSLKLKAYQTLQENRKFAECFDANFQQTPNKKLWVFMSPTITPIDVAGLAADWNASQNRQFTAGTAVINRPFKVFIKKSTYSYLLKNNSAACVRGRVHTFVVRDNIPNTTAAGFNTSSPLNIWNDGLVKQVQFDGVGNGDPTQPLYQWFHNHRFCTFFKHVGVSKTHMFRPQDGAKRFTYSSSNRLLDPLKLDTSTYAEIKGAKFHVWEFSGEMSGDITVTWTGSATTSHGGPGPINLHYLGEQRVEYSVMAKPFVVFDASDLRTLQISNTLGNIVPNYAPVANAVWNGTGPEYDYPTLGGKRNQATAPPALP